MRNGAENNNVSGMTLTRRNVSAISVILASAVLSGCRIDDQKFSKDKDQLNSQPPNCFLRGTRILTKLGYIKIEDLTTNDYAMTVSGEVRRIIWIGRIGRDQSKGPICFKKGAFSASIPSNDLFLSEGHRVYMFGLLVRAADFINTATVFSRQNWGDSHEYFHFMTEGGHAIIVAEGMPCETLQVQEGVFAKFDDAPSDAELAVLKPERPCAEVFDCYDKGKRTLLLSHLRSALSPWLELRNDKDIVRDILTDMRIKAGSVARA